MIAQLAQLLLPMAAVFRRLAAGRRWAAAAWPTRWRTRAASKPKKPRMIWSVTWSYLRAADAVQEQVAEHQAGKQRRRQRAVRILMPRTRQFQQSARRPRTRRVVGQRKRKRVIATVGDHQLVARCWANSGRRRGSSCDQIQNGASSQPSDSARSGTGWARLRRRASADRRPAHRCGPTRTAAGGRARGPRTRRTPATGRRRFAAARASRCARFLRARAGLAPAAGRGSIRAGLRSSASGQSDATSGRSTSGSISVTTRSAKLCNVARSRIESLFVRHFGRRAVVRHGLDARLVDGAGRHANRRAAAQVAVDQQMNADAVQLAREPAEHEILVPHARDETAAADGRTG